MKNVTFVYMLTCGAGVGTTLQVARGRFTKRGSFSETAKVCTVTIPEGEPLDHARIAAEYETPTHPSFWRLIK